MDEKGVGDCVSYSYSVSVDCRNAALQIAFPVDVEKLRRVDVLPMVDRQAMPLNFRRTETHLEHNCTGHKLTGDETGDP